MRLLRRVTIGLLCSGRLVPAAASTSPNEPYGDIFTRHESHKWGVMIAFASALFILLITPGPGVLTTAGVAAGFGFRAGLPYLAGIVSGALLVMIAVATGLAAFIFSFPPVRTGLLIVSLGYLVYLAFRIASAGSQIAIVASDKPLGYGNGLLLSVINPKAYAVSTMLFSGFPFYPDNILLENTTKLAIFLAIAVPIHLVWLGLGAGLKRLALRPRTARLLNIAMAVAMLAVVAIAALS